MLTIISVSIITLGLILGAFGAFSAATICVSTGALSNRTITYRAFAVYLYAGTGVMLFMLGLAAILE